jgi:tRNA modification GTPase
LSGAVNGIYDLIVGAAADLEASLDFPEEDFPDELAVGAGERVSQALIELDRLLATWEEGHRLRDGLLVVITGRPNAGKSTLLNRLLQRDRAIVSPTPGTTRDAIEETFVLDGLPLRLVDTAGLRTTDCSVERQGILKTRQYMAEADLRIHVIDASLPFSPEDKLSLAESDSRKVLIFLNKSDLCSAINNSNYVGYNAVRGSLLDSSDISPILEAMSRMLDQNTEWTPHATLSERHRNLILQAKTTLLEASGKICPQHPEHLVPSALHLRDAAGYLGQVTGRFFYQDLLDQVFARFCIGK